MSPLLQWLSKPSWQTFTLVDYQGRERHGWGPMWLLYQSRKLHSAPSEIVSLVLENKSEKRSSSLSQQLSENKRGTKLVLVSWEPLLYLEFNKPNKPNLYKINLFKKFNFSQSQKNCWHTDWLKTRRTCFLFLLENTAMKKGKKLVYFDHQNVNSLLGPSLRQQLVLVLCFYRGLV